MKRKLQLLLSPVYLEIIAAFSSFFLSLDPFSDMKDDDSFALTSSCLVSPVLSSHEKSTSSSSQERETFFSLLKHNF